MNYEENQAFMRAIEKADSFYIEGKFPIPIKDMIRDDEDVQLFTFGEFGKLAGVSRSRVSEIGQSDEAFHFKKGKKSFIVYNALKSISRQRFTLAHEYGHIKLNHAGKSLYDREKGTGTYTREEFEADTFASCLLFPLYKRYEYRKKSSYEIANKFSISFSAVWVCMRILECHLDSGLEIYLTRYEHRKSDSYINFLRECSF
ncbi:ImmA/IrrE family metallo-endopeptidase [Staphylococcus saprophyticus]|nr:ImmA/IrrE family metallo-endopeptidase [Staphylococcus saprophyticus]